MRNFRQRERCFELFYSLTYSFSKGKSPPFVPLNFLCECNHILFRRIKYLHSTLSIPKAFTYHVNDFIASHGKLQLLPCEVRRTHLPKNKGVFLSRLPLRTDSFGVVVFKVEIFDFKQGREGQTSERLHRECTVHDRHNSQKSTGCSDNLVHYRDNRQDEGIIPESQGTLQHPSIPRPNVSKLSSYTLSE